MLVTENKTEKEFWLEKLSGEISSVNLPYDYKKNKDCGRTKAAVPFNISSELFEILNKVSNGSDYAMHILFTSALFVFLNKYTKNNDLIIGTPIYGKVESEDSEENVVLIRNQINNNTFKNLVLTVRETILQANENGKYPLETLLYNLYEINKTNFEVFDIVIVLDSIQEKRFVDNLSNNINFIFYRKEDSIEGAVEYNSQLYRKETINKFILNYLELMTNLLTNFNSNIGLASMLSEAEKQCILYDFNNNKMDFPMDKMIYETIEKNALEHPDKIAIAFKEKAMSYRELNNRSNRIANYLRDQVGENENAIIGIIMERTLDFIVTILGIWKAGGAYVPLDPEYPQERIKNIINDAQMKVVISEKKYVRLLNILQGECAKFSSYLCIDSTHIIDEDEYENSVLMDEKLWGFIGNNATDEITGGGWISSYTGLPFSKNEMDEYASNIFEKVSPYLNENTKVLEIGCASGISMFKIAPKVGLYYGTDLSSVIIEKNMKRIQVEGQKNIKLKSMPAHEIGNLEIKDFDLIIINSVIQDFNGHNYLRKVIKKCINAMKNTGHIFIGDVMDQNLKQQLIEDLKAFKLMNKDSNFTTKTEWKEEMFYTKFFFEDLKAEVTEIKDVVFSNKIHTLQNELTKFRYDVMLEVNKLKKAELNAYRKHKHQHDLSVLDKYPCEKVLNQDKYRDLNRLAYIIYTSGSTGNPKGVMVEHLGMMNHMYAKVKDLQLAEDAIIAQNASYTFDISVWQMFTALIVGGKTVVYQNEIILEPERFIKQLVEDEISVLEVVPSYLKVMLENLALNKTSLNKLKYIVVTGETLPVNLVDQWFSLYKNIKIVNAYGPTEASDDITHYLMEENPNLERIPIGRPVANLNIYIVDENMSLCPIGVKGEICVSGIGVGRGYLNDRVKTEKVFMNDRFKKDETSRLYKTGDLGCWREDGTIDFFGRIDHQVKIRGFRIELGEIEKNLLRHNDVKDAAVVDKKDENGGSYLCAYITSDTKVNIETLKDYLRQSLPYYMIPQNFMIIDRMPLTANGKVDRKALAYIKCERRVDEIQELPNNDMEIKLLKTFKEVLASEEMAVSDNFFEVGGDSIKAIQVVSRLQKDNLKLDINDIFLKPTIKELAATITEMNIEIEQGLISGEILLTPVERWFFETKKTKNHHYNQSLALYSRRELDEEALKSIFSKLVEQHDALRMSFDISDERVIQNNRGLDEEIYELRVFELKLDEEIEKQIELECDKIQRSLSFNNGKLIKLALFKTGKGDYLVIIAHHLIIDGISWRIILEDLKLGYRQHMNGENIKLQEKTHSYQCWANKLNEYAQGEKVLNELVFWKSLEDEKIEKISKGNSTDKHNKISGNFKTVTMKLGSEHTAKLLTDVNKVYNTEINDILISALGITLEKWAGINKIAINMEGHGREAVIEDMFINRTVGWFTSQYPLLISTEGCNDIGYYIKATKEMIRKIPNKGINYGVLRYLTEENKKPGVKLQIEPEINFNYLGQFDEYKGEEDFTIVSVAIGDLENSICVGRSESEELERNESINIEGVVINNELIISFGYNIYEFDAKSIENLMENYKISLINIIEHCCNKDNNEITPSDLSYNELTINELDELEDYLDKIDL